VSLNQVEPVGKCGRVWLSEVEYHPYNQNKHPSKEYIAKMKQEHGDDNVEYRYCHWPGHRIDSHQKRQNKNSKPNYTPRKGWSHVNQRRQNPQYQNHQNENYRAIFNGGGGGNIANITEHQAFSTHRSDPCLWSVNSSCTVHFIPVKNRLFNSKSHLVTNRVEVVKGEFCDVVGSGSVQLEYSNGIRYIIHNVLYALDLRRALLSFAKLM